MYEVINYALGSASGIAVFLVINKFWGQYFIKKGENVAMIEDIGKITKIVEEIKADLSRETEVLKAEMLLRAQHTLSLKLVEREAILDFQYKATHWINLLCNVKISDYHIMEAPNMNSWHDELQQVKLGFDTVKDKLMMLIRDTVFLSLSHDLTKYNLEFQEYIDTSLSELHSFKIILYENEHASKITNDEGFERYLVAAENFLKGRKEFFGRSSTAYNLIIIRLSGYLNKI